jgi:hypothetical protein
METTGRNQSVPGDERLQTEEALAQEMMIFKK